MAKNNIKNISDSKTKKTRTKKPAQTIEAHNVRVNNLKGIDVTIPRDKFVVVTGLSGSGKSSLAFDTLYAEGQRRYVESLSAYARQFMGKMHKPEADWIKGLPPAIAIEQKVNTRNPRSTVGTATEIYDYMRLLFARIGRIYSPISGKEVKKHTLEDVYTYLNNLPQGSRIALLSPIALPEKRRVSTQLQLFVDAGYWRLFHDGEFVDINEILAQESNIPASLDRYMLVIDRSRINHDDKDEMSRLYESVETAFYEGHGIMSIAVWNTDGSISTDEFSDMLTADGMTFEEPTELMFNFNNPYGACPRCEGFGKVIGIDEKFVIPNQALSVYDDAVSCWKGDKMSEWKRAFIYRASSHNFPIHTPYNQLTEDQKDLLWHGAPDIEGIDQFFNMVESNLYKIQYRVMKARYQGKTICPECHGGRLNRNASYVRINGLNISELVKRPIDQLTNWFASLELTPNEAKIAERPLEEIRNRLQFMQEVGLGYLTLDRQASTLSGGESQRINLASSLGSSLIGSLYILDEPSIGLHSRDTERLIGVLRRLQSIGNTVVVVEHDEDIMHAADFIVDVGPEAGSNGGEIVYQGPADNISSASRSYTAKYLDGSLSIPVPATRRKTNRYIEITNACEHNLKGINVKFPLETLTVVTGVSGSGKSTLVRDILFRALTRHLGDASDAPGAFGELKGDLHLVSRVDFVDQNPIGKSSRSNPATYMKAYDDIRALFASQQSAKQMGLTASHFSFNSDGGRCPECKGEGTITIEMQFMADVVIPCESCHGERFKREVLDVLYRDKNINDILQMTVDDAITFFSESSGSIEKKIVKRLKPLQEVGLGYIQLGQSSSTLSGGENQRVKLAWYLASESASPTVFIFDEPTTGLHFHDISTLLKAFDRLIENGHTVIVIEHNMDVIKQADYVIDIGPEGGEAGGNLVVTGTPEEIASCPASYTGRYLKEKLQHKSNSKQL